MPFSFLEHLFTDFQYLKNITPHFKSYQMKEEQYQLVYWYNIGI